MESIENGVDSSVINESEAMEESIGTTSITSRRPADIVTSSTPSTPRTPNTPNPQEGRKNTTIPTSPRSPRSPAHSVNQWHLQSPASMPAGSSQPSSPPRSSSGLSELSKQLRALQANNEAKSAEIDRLTRQVQILADLQGVSVANLRKALDDACEAAALAELQSRVAGLKAQLKAATALREGGSNEKNVQEDFMAKKVANLELKVGELEELDERQRREKLELFNRLREKTDEIARLEARIFHLSTENERLNKEKDQSPSFAEANAVLVPSDETVQGINPEDHIGDRTNYEAKITALETRLQEVESELQTTRTQLDLSNEQKQSEGEQAKLRNSQFKARFIVQEDNIRDLEQQLSSLYAAFSLLRDERDEEERERLALQCSLGQADAALARLHSQKETSGAKTANISQGSPKTSEMVPIVSTQLWVRGTGNFRQWKKHPAVLYSTMSHHVLDLGTGKTYNLYFELATLSYHRLQVFGFIVHLNPNDPRAPELWLAASNREDYGKWMEALVQATTEATKTTDESFSSQQEELEFEHALKLSEQEK